MTPRHADGLRRRPRARALIPLLLCHLLLASSPRAAAEPAEIYTGRELLADCKREAAPGEQTACQGWIDWAMSSTHYYCLPPQIDDAAVRATLIGWFEAHAPKLHMPGGWLVQNALVDTYPCKRR